MKKRHLYILAGLVIFLVGGAVLAWQKKSDQKIIQNQTRQENITGTDTDIDTSDWKTYQHNEYGFEIKYPTSWTILKNAGSNSDRSVISLISPETQKMIQERRMDSSCDLSIYYYFSVTDEPENKSNGLEATTLEEVIDKNRMITRIGQTMLSGEQAIDVVWGGAGAYYTVLSDHGGHLYKLSSCNKEKRGALTSTELTILESFKFLR